MCTDFFPGVEVIWNTLELILDSVLVQQFLKDINENKEEKGLHYAVMFGLPRLIYGIFIAFSWWKLTKLKTFENERRWHWILIVLQIYPQYRSLKRMCKKNKTQDDEELERRDEIISSNALKAYVETIPLLLVLNCYNVEKNVYTEVSVLGLVIGVRFFMSAVSGLFGLIKLLQSGTCRVLPQKPWSLMCGSDREKEELRLEQEQKEKEQSKCMLWFTYGLGYYALWAIVTTIFIGKGMALAVLVFLRNEDYEWPTIVAVSTWFALYVAPQFIISTISLAWNLKTKFFSILSTHFALLLCPVYTCFSFGPAKTERTSPSYTSIAVSPLLTTINVIITLAVHVYLYTCLPAYGENQGPLKDKYFLGIEIPVFKYYDLFYHYAQCVYYATFVGFFFTIAFVNTKHFNQSFGKLDPDDLLTKIPEEVELVDIKTGVDQKV